MELLTIKFNLINPKYEYNKKSVLDYIYNSDKDNSNKLKFDTIYLREIYNPENGYSYEKSLGYKYETKAKESSKVVIKGPDITGFSTIHITTNLETIVKKGWVDDLEFIESPSSYSKKRATIKLSCSVSFSNYFIGNSKLIVSTVNSDVTRFLMPNVIPYKDGNYEVKDAEDFHGNFVGYYATRNGNLVAEDEDFKLCLEDYLVFLDKFLIYSNNILQKRKNKSNKTWGIKTPQDIRNYMSSGFEIRDIIISGFVDDLLDICNRIKKIDDTDELNLFIDFLKYKI